MTDEELIDPVKDAMEDEEPMQLSLCMGINYEAPHTLEAPPFNQL